MPSPSPDTRPRRKVTIINSLPLCRFNDSWLVRSLSYFSVQPENVALSNPIWFLSLLGHETDKLHMGLESKQPFLSTIFYRLQQQTFYLIRCQCQYWMKGRVEWAAGYHPCSNSLQFFLGKEQLRAALEKLNTRQKPSPHTLRLKAALNIFACSLLQILFATAWWIIFQTDLAYLMRSPNWRLTLSLLRS